MALFGLFCLHPASAAICFGLAATRRHNIDGEWGLRTKEVGRGGGVLEKRGTTTYSSFRVYGQYNSLWQLVYPTRVCFGISMKNYGVVYPTHDNDEQDMYYIS